uniref:Sushi domain-containing protein n=1 Tax=Parastrongyloides trichosuri TaxID=131310 RepID=A0A0N4ZV73_PARTI
MKLNHSIINATDISNNSTTKLNNEVLSHSVPRCSPKENVPNGSLRYSIPINNNTYIHGTIAILSCNNGYQHIGDLISTCIEGTNWTKIGFCVETASMTCQPITINQENSYIIYKPGNNGLMKEGTTANLMCNRKSEISGNSVINCTKNGWETKSFGRCVLKNENNRLKRDTSGTLNINTQITCSQLTVDHGTIQYYETNTNGIYPQGTSAMLMCDSNYEPVGVTFCMCSNGTWNPQIGSCKMRTNDLSIQSTTQYSINSRIKRQITLSPTLFNPFTVASTTGYCLMGFPFVFGGSVTYSNNQIFGPFPSGTTATLTCTSGTINGASTSTCVDGTWSTVSLGTCDTTATNSLTLPTITSMTSCTTPVSSELGGSISYTQGTTYGPYPHLTVATLSCDVGSTISGTSTATCMNGVWSPSSLGKCSSNSLLTGSTIGINGLITQTLSSIITNDQCISGVIDPLNGKITYSNGATYGPYPSGTIATLTCNTGFTPLASYTATCTGGIFSPQTTVPTCVSTSSNSVIPNGSNTLTTSGSCFTLPAPLSGTIDYSSPITSTTLQYPIGTIATLTCNTGYTISGTLSSTCQSTGWSPFGLGTCIASELSPKKLDCNRIDDQPNGLITYEGNNIYEENYNSKLPHGTTAFLYCYFNYNPIGFGRTSCNNGEWKPKHIGSCSYVKKKCKKIDKTISGVLFEYFDDYINVSCQDGYQSTGVTRIQCLQSGEWNVEDIQTYSFCKKIKPTFIEKKIYNEKMKKEESINSCTTPWDGNSLYNYKYNEIFLSNKLLSNGLLPHNTYVSLKCKESILSGSDEAYCINGNWIPQLGFCKIQEKKIINMKNTLSKTSCQNILSPSNGYIKYIQSSTVYSNEIGTHGVLHCNKGYRITGNPLVTCTINGWVPITGLGNCEKLSLLSFH